MGWDYSVYVKAKKQKRDKIRELAARMAKSFEGELVDDDEDDDEEESDDSFDLGVAFANGGGRFSVERLKRGYHLYTDSQMNSRNDEAIQDIGGVMDLVASKLGTVIEDKDVIAEMIEESEEAPNAVARVAPVAVVRAADRAGALLEEVTLDAGVVLAAIDGAGMLRDVSAHPSITEEGRYVAKTARLTATLFDEYGAPYRRHQWACDGYGRIISANVEELAD